MFPKHDFMVLKNRMPAEEHGEVVAIGHMDLKVLIAKLPFLVVDHHIKNRFTQGGLTSRGVNVPGFLKLEFQVLCDRVRDHNEITTGIEERVNERSFSILVVKLNGNQGIIPVFKDERLFRHGALV